MLMQRENDVDFDGGDLDVQRRNLPKNTPKITLKDEENQLYG